METAESQKKRCDSAAFAVAGTPRRAADLVRLLAKASVSVGEETDLEAVLARGPALVVIDPDGWEASCRVSLEAFDRRATPPPAVLLASASPLAPYTAGPSFGVLPPDARIEELAWVVERARSAHQRFCSYWPTLLNPFPPRDLRRLTTVLEWAVGLEIRADRTAAFVEAVRQRMVARLIPTVREYADYLEGASGVEEEVDLLSSLLSVGETHFWRYSGQFRAFQSLLIPEITKQERRLRRLRLWSAGCASGEEVYSLAIACREALPKGWDWEVVGTDIHKPSLAFASRGVYSARALRNLPEELSRRYLAAGPAGARVCEDLRQAVRFEPLNLGGTGLRTWIRQNGPFDAIFCRNTLIYFGRPAAERVLSSFEGGLVPGGGLFLGASETMGQGRDGFRTVRGPGCFFYVKEAQEQSPEKRELPGASPRGPSNEATIEALYRRGILLADREDFVGAGESFRSILELDPEDGRGHTGLGLLLANEGRETEAARHLESARRNGPELVETHYLLGLVKERLGREQEALSHYERTLGRDSSFFMAHFNRAGILKRTGRKDASLEELEQARRLLNCRPPASPWVTGGLSVETLLGIVTRALRAEEGPA